MVSTPAGSADALVALLRETLAARAGDADEVLLHERAVAAQPPRLDVLRPRLPAPLARALVARGISQLYAHQVAATGAVRARSNVVLASPTASGKSLSFALPTFERLLQTPGAHALYLYPTKALMSDQFRALDDLAASLPPPESGRRWVGLLSGDTPMAERARLAAEPPAVLLANPDILHRSVLPDHRRWRRLLGALEVVVLDELHSYRGVFGAHVALVLRRLRRLAARYGARPTFVAASATVANPVELAEQVVGLPFVAIGGDTAGAGPRRFLFWRPPLRGLAEANEHESVLDEAAAIFAEALRAGYSGILFGRARVSVERMLLEVRQLVGPGLADRVSAYKSGYTLEERSRIEAGLRSGRLRGVVSTNALELGIDIGGLDVAVLAGYPGSSMSFWQQAGRVGRRAEREAVVVFVAGDDALDQYHVQHPEALFGQPVEQAVIDPTNAAIQLGHLLCAAAEQPLSSDDLALLPPNAPRLLERLAAAGELVSGPPWLATGRPPHAEVSLRGTAREPYTLHGPRGALGTIEPPYLQRECYPGAIYLHNGRAFRVQALEPAAHVVRLVEAPLSVRTTPIVEVEVAPREAPVATRTLGDDPHPLQASVGPLRVRERVVGYREIQRRQSLSYGLTQPLENILETVGLWIDVPRELEPDVDGLHAFEHGLVNALRLHLLCDRRDIGSSTSAQRVYVYDFAEGGIGLADKGYVLLETVMARAAALLRDCPCRDGCPSCIHLVGCPDGNNRLDKVAGLALLEGRAANAARAAARLLRGDPARRPVDGASRRRHLREIADADLRERFSAGAAGADRQPTRLEPGSLAHLADVGLVLVWQVEDDWADVQVLADGRQRRVLLSALSAPRAS